MSAEADGQVEVRAPEEPVAQKVVRLERRTIAKTFKACSAVVVWFVGLLEPITKIAINVGILGAIVFGGPAIYKMVTQPNFVIKDISVPGSLSERGFTGDVIAQQILDQISTINALAGSKKDKAEITGIDLESTMPSINLPVGGFNLASIVSELRKLFGYTETAVTGEIYVATPSSGDTPAQYAFRLRIAGVGPIFRTAKPGNDIEQLIDEAAQQVMRRFDPINLGYYYYQQHDYQHALEMTDLALADPSPDNDPWAYTMRGLVQRDQNKLAEAATNLRQAIELSPNFWLGYANLSGLLRLDGKLEEAEAAARKAIEIAPNEQEGHAALALVLIERGDNEGALAEMHRGVEVDPKDPGGYLQMGKLQTRLRMFDEAVKSFKTSAALNPSAEPLMNAAATLRTLQRHEDAMGFLKEATETDPRNVAAWLLLGETALDRNDIKRAAEAFTKAVGLDPTGPQTPLDAARAYAEHKRFNEADAILAKAAKSFEKNAEFLLGSSDVLWIEGRKSEAAAKTQEALQIGKEQESSETFEAAGRMLEERGDFDGAHAAYMQAVEFDPMLAGKLKPLLDRISAQLPTGPTSVERH